MAPIGVASVEVNDNVTRLIFTGVPSVGSVVPVAALPPQPSAATARAPTETLASGDIMRRSYTPLADVATSDIDNETLEAVVAESKEEIDSIIATLQI